MKIEENMKRHSFLKTYKLPLSIIFSFIFGCMFAFNLVPLDKTCQIDNSERDYNFIKNSKFKNPELIILIPSAPKNLDRRNVIRNTWLNLIKKGQEHKTENNIFKMKHFFAIGSVGLTTDEVLHLSAEQSEFGDILILPIQDSYNNLTLKILKSFEWLSEQFDYGLGYKYVLKVDDDSFVRLDHIVHEIQHLETLYLKSQLPVVNDFSNDESSPYIRINVQVSLNETRNKLQLYWGYFNGKAHIQNNGKWKEKNWIFCDRYLPYALGGGYILSKDLVSYIGKNAPFLRMYRSEDVSVGFWLSSLNNIIRVHDIRFDTEWISRGCQNYHLISHNIPISDMNKMYLNIIKTNYLCSEQKKIRKAYFYNWSQPPSQCCNIKD